MDVLTVNKSILIYGCITYIYIYTYLCMYKRLKAYMYTKTYIYMYIFKSV